MPIRRYGCRLMAAAILMAMAVGVSAQLPPGAQRDQLELRMVDAVKAEKYSEFLQLLADYRALGHAPGAEMRYYEGVALSRAGQALPARAALEAFIAQAGGGHPLYREALSRHAALEAAAVKEEAGQRQVDAFVQSPLIQAMGQGGSLHSSLWRGAGWIGYVGFGDWFLGQRQRAILPTPDGGVLAVGAASVPPARAEDFYGNHSDGRWPRLDIPHLPPAAVQRLDANGKLAWQQTYDWSVLPLRRAARPGEALAAGGAMRTASAEARWLAGQAPGLPFYPHYRVRGRVAGQPGFDESAWRSQAVALLPDARGGARLCANIQLGDDNALTPRRWTGVWAPISARGEIDPQTGVWGMPWDSPEAGAAPGHWYDSGLDDCVALPDGAMLVAGRAVARHGDPGREAKGDPAQQAQRVVRVFEPDGRLRASLFLRRQELPAWGAAPAQHWGSPPLEAAVDGDGWVWLWQGWQIDARDGALRSMPRTIDAALAHLRPPAEGQGLRLRVAGRDTDLLPAQSVRQAQLVQAGRLADGTVLALLNIQFAQGVQAALLPDGQRLDADLLRADSPLGVLAAFDAHSGALRWALPLRHGDKQGILGFAQKVQQAARGHSGSAFRAPPELLIRFFAETGYRWSHWTELPDGRVLVGTESGMTMAVRYGATAGTPVVGGGPP